MNEGVTEKAVPPNQRLSSFGKPWIPKGDPRDSVFSPTLTFMIDSYIVTREQRNNI